MSAQEFDYVVVGSGSSGGIVAARLSEDPRARVLVLEAGPPASGWLFKIPAAARYAFNAAAYNWNYLTEPEPHLDGRRLKQPRGRIVGGSSSINGMVYLRGNPLDFEDWSEAGAAGWAYADVLPYFQRLEGWVNPTNPYQGRSGPVGISVRETLNPISQAFLDAAQEAGYALTDDVNGYKQEGAGRFPTNAADGLRWSTARAYLERAADRSNLEIRTGCIADRIEFDGNRAVALHYRRNGTPERVTFAGELIVSAGAFNSPKLLMLSGVGPADHLREHGIDVVHDLPGVGQNLMDHQLSAIQMECKEPVSLYGQMGTLSKARAALRWLVRKDGLLSHNHFECGAFLRSAAGVKFPDLQLYLFPVAVAEGSNDFYKFHGFQIQVSAQRSLSRGWVKLASADPDADPRILFNYMSHEQDWIELRAAIRLAREIAGQPAMDRYRGKELTPGPDVRTDAEIDAFLRANMQSSYHACGTCRMGSDDMAVVDPQLRLRGFERVRIADASIMPTVPSCNLNSPSMMVGEKAADHIRGSLLPPSNLDYFLDPDWQTRQRPGTPVREVAS